MSDRKINRIMNHGDGCGDWVDRAVRQVWAEKPGLGIRELQQEILQKCEQANAAFRQQALNNDTVGNEANKISMIHHAPLHSSMITKARIKHAKLWIPYRQLPSLIKLDDTQLAFVKDKIQDRIAFRATHQYNQADHLQKALEAMGIEIDDHKKTWKVIKTPPYNLPTNDKHDNQTCSQELLLPKTSQTICKFCQKVFPSRNHVFKHLRDPTSGCGTVIFATGQHIEDPPSVVQAKQRREESARRQNTSSNARGRAARHASAENSLWVGNLPFPWTNPKRQFSHLRALLFHYIPRHIPSPWIKRVIRKAYRKGEDALYHGYAIVVFRDETEASQMRNHLDNLRVDPAEVFRNNGRLQDGDTNEGLHAFVLQVSPVQNSDMFSASWNGMEGTASNVAGGTDPPLADQLRPLGLDELKLRFENMLLMLGQMSDVNVKKYEIHVDNDADRTELLISKLSQMYEQKPECRRFVQRKGKLVPTLIRDRLVQILETLRWPAKNERGGLAAERYLVLQTNVENDRFYSHLRTACRELMDWVDPDYFYSGIAVTKNFVASPHIDHRDQSFQYAISLGNFENGGELCVEGVDPSGLHFVNVVDTKDRITRVDGRHVHYVRTWEGGDRYSLIFYDTSDRCSTPILTLGVDEHFLDEE